MKKDPRIGLIAKIHVAKRDMDLDEVLYREMLKTAVRKTSLRAMNVVELERVVRYFKLKGWQPKSPKRGRSAARRRGEGLPKRELEGKIWALFYELDSLDELRRLDAAVVDAYVERMTAGEGNRHFDNGPRVSAMRFASDKQLHRIVESLKKWVRRVHVRVAVEMCEELMHLTGSELLRICGDVGEIEIYATVCQALEKKGWTFTKCHTCTYLWKEGTSGN